MTRNAVMRCLVLLGLSACAIPARAQAPDEPSPIDPVQKIGRPVEVVFAVDDLTSWIGRGQDVRLSLSMPRNERMSVEIFGGAYRGNEGWNIRSVWGMQMRQRLMRVQGRGQEAFVTYGAVALVAPEECVGQSCSYQGSVVPLGTLGFGFQQSIASRLAVRAELQGGFVFFVPVGVRVSAGVVIPIGSRRVARVDH